MLEPYLGLKPTRAARTQRLGEENAALLWDWKASVDLSTMTYWGLHAYTRACGWSLARAHARSGDRLAIAAYLGAGTSFDRAIARFSAAYADQNERDHQRLADAAAAGEVRALRGV